jgi:hypothetical protein
MGADDVIEINDLKRMSLPATNASNTMKIFKIRYAAFEIKGSPPLGNMLMY